MADHEGALGGRGTELFGGIPVSDFQASLAWYQRLLGSPPSFFPNDHEAVWAVGDHRWVYIIRAPERAGRSIQTIMCDNLEAVIAEIAARGIAFTKDETPAKDVRKVLYYDPDGNEIGIGRIPAE